jgi:hypothetical protein
MASVSVGRARVEEVPRITIHEMSRSLRDSGVAIVQLPGLATPAVVRVTRTQQAIGGARDWFVCPTCQRPRAWLAVVHQSLACRTCHGLAYTSQNVSTLNRRDRRACALYARINVETAPMERTQGPKPFAMHWRTYWQLVDEACRIDPWASFLTLSRYPRRWRRHMQSTPERAVEHLERRAGRS